MRNSTKVLLALLLVAFTVSISSCGTSAVQPAPEQLSGTVSGSELLADLNSLDAPAGMAVDEFDALKDSLKRALQIAPDAKFVVHPPQGPHSAVTDLTLAILPDGSSGSNGIQWTYVNPGDYNYDGQVNLHDLANLGAYLGVDSSSETWERAKYVDGDGNGAITIADLVPIAANFLGTVTAWQIDVRTEDGVSDGYSPSQIPFSAGDSQGDLRPPEFMFRPVNWHGPSTSYYIKPVDSLGQSPDEYIQAQPFVTAPNVKALGESAYIDGDVVRINGQEADDVRPGDILMGGSGDTAFLVKAEAGVSDEETASFSFSPATLNQLIGRGQITLYANPFEGEPESLDISGLDLSPSADLQLKVVAGKIDLASSGVGLTTSISPFSGLQFIRLTSGHSLDLNLTMQVTSGGGAREFDGTDTERLIATKVYTEDDAQFPAGPLPIPVEVTQHIYFGVYGQFYPPSPASDSYLVPINRNTGYVYSSCHYDPATGYSQALAQTQGGSSISLDLAPTVESTAPNGGVKIVPYIRVETSVSLFPGTHGDPQVPEFGSDMTFGVYEQLVRDDSPQAGTEVRMGIEDSGRFQLSLKNLGLDLAFTSPVEEQPTYFSSMFYPDPPPAITRTITGYTFDGSSPLPGVTVTVRDSSSLAVLGIDVTDGEGFYSVAELADGAMVTVTPELAEYTFTPSSQDFTLDSDKSVDFFGSPAVPQTYGISGFVTDFGTSTPMAGVQIFLYEQGTLNEIGHSETNASGFYSFSGLTPFSAVRVQPLMGSMVFTPTWADLTVTGELGQDFAGHL